MNAEKMIKKEAKSALSGKWITALVSLVVLSFAPIVTGCVAAAAFSVLGDARTADVITNEPVRAIFFFVLNVAAVAVLVLLSPVYPGFVRVFSMFAEGKEPEALDVFWFFDSRGRYKNAVAFMSALLVKCLGIIVACEAAALAVAVYGADSDALRGVAIALAVVGGIAAILIFHRFAFSVMLFSYYDYDGLSAAQTGASIAKTETGKLLRLTFSFLPWVLFTALVVPVFFVYPYMTCAYFVSAKYLIASFREAEEAKKAAAQPAPEPVQPAAAGLTLEKAPENAAEDSPDAARQPAADAAPEPAQGGETPQTAQAGEKEDEQEAAQEPASAEQGY